MSLYKRQAQKSVMIVLSVLISLLGVSCKKEENKTVVEKKINVRVHSVEKVQMRPYIETIGTLNPNEDVTVSAEIDGILKEVRVEEGSSVSKGSVIAVIDDADYSLEVKRAEAALRQAEASLDNAKIEHKRKEALYKEELVTKQQFDDIMMRLELASAGVESAKSSLSLARQRLSKTKIYSPITGSVSEKRVSAGDYARNGTPLFKIIQTNPLKLNFSVPEKDAVRVRAGQEVAFRVDAFHDKEFRGIVGVVYPNLDEKTRSLHAEARVSNKDDSLKPGLFAGVSLFTGSPKDSVVVPSIALLYEGQKVRLFVAEGDTAKERTVKTGQKFTKKEQGSADSAQRDFTEILEGVKEGEMVITVGQQNLADGVKVNVAR